MKQQKRINKILEAVEARIQSEVGALLGADLSLVSGEKKLVSKEHAFDSLQGKQICAQMEISGEITGKSCLLIGIKDAIRLGGTLIMLPVTELEEVIGREDYSEEIKDSFGEIANIIAGSITKDFEEMYPQSCRFVRKQQEIIVPAKVVADSDDPVANQTYYMVSAAMVLDGRPMGDMVVLIPAAPFGLQEQESIAEAGGEPKDASIASDAGGRLEGSAEKCASGQEGEKNAPQEPPSEAVRSTAAPKFDPKKHQEKVNRLLVECQKRLENEVGALLAANITLSDQENRLLSKEEFFFDQVAGRQILADLEVTGEVQGKSYLSLSVKDAIHLGGILIMLPPAELENVVREEEFGEDARDAYGEIANIISGVYTAVFEEQYTQKLRFIRKELREVVPGKVETASAEPFPDTTYYSSSLTMAVDGKPLGRVHMLFPAELLCLDGAEEKTKPERGDAGSSQEEDGGVVTEKQSAVPAEAGNSPSGGAAGAVLPDVSKHKKRVDKILAACRDRMMDEVSALLGTDLKLSNPENFIVSKEAFFFDEVSGKQVITDMDLVGEVRGKSYLSVALRDAIMMGGTLIMLPAAELESVAAEENFSEDTQDAYGEIANIISGVYTAVFEEQYSKKIRFIKKHLHQVVPMKVDIGADDPLADQDYYLSRMDLSLGNHDLGQVNMLIPAALLELDGLRPKSAAAVENNISLSEQVVVDQEKTAMGGGQTIQQEDLHSLDILVVGDDDNEAAKIVKVLENAKYSVGRLTFKDNLHNYIPGNLKAIYLVMRDVNEQAFGVAIKVSSACSVPLIAAGPDWTRTKVIKAVKYGVRDIILTPASEGDLLENVQNNLFKLAA